MIIFYLFIFFFFIFAPRYQSLIVKVFNTTLPNILFFKMNVHFINVLLSVLHGKSPTDCTSLQKELHFIVRVPQILKCEGHRSRMRSAERL